MTLYLDASVLVSLFCTDSGTPRAHELLKATTDEILVSDFARLEFVSTVAKLVRTRTHDKEAAGAAFAAFESWSARFTTPVETTRADLIAAQAIIRRLDTRLRTGDALHIATTDRLGATLAAFDRALAEAARSIRVAIVI